MNYNFYSLERLARDVQVERQREAALEQRYRKVVRSLKRAKRAV